ncbi:MAG TPA: DUF2948 family protein [Stellaceae bacterium]|jgi:hypothetical protein|nr:DUF2948 family protein [Stellaceae bacterium]
MPADESGAAFKLRAEDADDLAVISACLQDALVAVRDLAFVPQDHTFLMVANRFRWERASRSARGEAGYQRTLCGITFGAVIGVSYHGFRRSEDTRILSLLAIRPGRDNEDDAILLEFSDGAAIRLEVSCIFCHAQDLGEPWPTPWQPWHDVDERV